MCGSAELETLTPGGSSAVFHPVVSMPSVEYGQAWNGPTGLVHEAACSLLAHRLTEIEWYCAGPPAMTEALQRELVLTHGVPVGQIHFDRFF